jgi:hypothetical protein
MASVLLLTSPEALLREGLREIVLPWEDGLRLEAARGTFEWWYFDAHFEDGSTAVIVFATKPLLERKGPLKPNVSLTITRPDGSKLAQFPVLPASAFSASTEGCDVRIGPHYVKGDLRRYQIHVEMGELAADLTFTGSVPPWRPGAGKACFGDLNHFFAWLPAIPYGRVEGTLRYDGHTHEVRGVGYHDHNWGNVGLQDVMDHWYWGRAHVGEYTLIFVEQVAAKAYGFTRIPVFFLAQGDQILCADGAPLTMTARQFVRHTDGRQYPLQIDFDWQRGSESVHLALRQPHLIEAVSLLSFYPNWQRRLFRLFANPYYFRFRAALELSIDLKEVQTIEHGTALYEIMILQGNRHP